MFVRVRGFRWLPFTDAERSEASLKGTTVVIKVATPEEEAEIEKQNKK